MLQTYQGYFLNGTFITSDNAVIPDKTPVIVTILDDIVSDGKTNRQRSAFESFFNAIDSSDMDLLSNEDFMELETTRLSFKRDIDL